LLYSAEITILACNQTTLGNCVFCRKLLICLRPEYGTASRGGMQVDRRDSWPVLVVGWRGEFRTPCGFHTAWYIVIPVGSICNACFHNTNPFSQGSSTSKQPSTISIYLSHALRSWVFFSASLRNWLLLLFSHFSGYRLIIFKCIGGGLAVALRYKPESCGFDSQRCHWNIIDLILPSVLQACGWFSL
jgi:hypothetical protein